MLDFLDGYSAQLVYILLFFLLILCGLGFPMPEELVLLTGGALVASGALHPVQTFVATFLGVIIGDVLLFGLGRGLASRMTSSAYAARWLSPQRLLKGEAFFTRHGSTALFLVRFIPGLRAPAFLLAGTSPIGCWRFIIMDTLAALFFVPLIGWIGYVCADHFDGIAAWFRSMEQAVATLIALAVLCWLIWCVRGRRHGRLPAPPPDTVAHRQSS